MKKDNGPSVMTACSVASVLLCALAWVFGSPETKERSGEAIILSVIFLAYFLGMDSGLRQRD